MAGVFKKTAPGGGTVEFNMTPMIDVTFQLIIFFILIGQIASEELARLDVAKPTKSVADAKQEFQQNRIVVNVVSASAQEKDEDLAAAVSGRAKHYKILTKEIELGKYDKLKRLIKETFEKFKADGGDPEAFFLEVRADWRVNYQYIEPVLQAGSESGLHSMTITALEDIPG